MRGCLLRLAVSAVAVICAASGALVTAAAAQATPIGNLAVNPSAGTDQSLITMSTSGLCTDPSATYVSMAIVGSGFATGGTNVIGATPITNVARSGGGYSLPLSDTLATIALEQTPPVTYSGDYTLDLKCRVALDFTSLGDFTATIRFSDAHHWTVVSGSEPVFTAAAHLTGTARVGYSMACSATITGATSVKYRWFRNGSGLAATGATYQAQPADALHTLTCQVTATNGGGSTVSTSAGRVVALGLLRNVTRPTQVGTALPGHTMTCRVGTWTPAPNAYAYKWILNGVGIRGATKSTLKIAALYVGRTLACGVTASRPGYATLTSVSTALRVR